MSKNGLILRIDGLIARRRLIAVAKVDDNAENMAICRRFCGTCPTFQENRLMDSPPNALFCARGKSERTEAIANRGCNCPDCDVFKNYGLSGGFFCVR